MISYEKLKKYNDDKKKFEVACSLAVICRMIFPAYKRIYSKQ